LLVLGVLLPVNWYWGRRLAEPLVRLARRMDDIQQRPPEHLAAELYPYRDELGHLFDAYNRMVVTLREKAALESEVVKGERLTALGRLSSGIAHEINNPLAGMLTALDTLRQRDNLDARAQRTLGLLERGLQQIRDTVATLLVEARPQSRDLEPRDMEDVHTLIAPAAARRGVQLSCTPELEGPLPLPAGFVRQILVNLLLNAVQAAPEGGQVELVVRHEAGELRIEVGNTGSSIPPEVMAHLYEPFARGREGGHGLGLWVTYQIVSQLGGSLSATNLPGGVRFTVHLPLGESA
jgi:signal transduction histidine kinase